MNRLFGENQDKPIVIVGAGISGLTLSILCKELKRKVIILEKRAPYSLEDAEDPRSFNLTITERGMKSFREIGIEKDVLQKVVPLKSRVVHPPASCLCDDRKIFQSYGSEANDVIYSIRRCDLIQVLYREAKKNQNAEIHFDTEVIEVDKHRSTLVFKSQETGEESKLAYEFLIGADGAYSKVRNSIIFGEIVNLHITYFSWVYKKFLIPKNDAKILKLEPASLHVFPQKGALAVAIPNQDESFSSIYCTEMINVSDLKSEEAHQKIEDKFAKDFPHLFHISEKLRDTLKHSKISGLVDVNLSKWRYEDKIILLGDAAHAVFPFYGQGMNSALQDCRMLVSLLTTKNSVLEAFEEYESVQKQSTNALSELCRAHFDYLQEKCFSPLCQARGQIDDFLKKIKPLSWNSEYSLVAQTELPYNKITEILKRKNFLRKVFFICVFDYTLALGIYISRKVSSFCRHLKKGMA